MDATTAAAIAAALDQVGTRLQRIRTQRELTLTAVAEATGISKSTLSRLETGHRRPTLDLLLALSHVYRVPLDDLVAAPEGSSATRTGCSGPAKPPPSTPPSHTGSAAPVPNPRKSSASSADPANE